MDPTKISWAPVLDMYPAGTPRELGKMLETERRWAEENPIIAGVLGPDNVLLVRYTSPIQLRHLLEEIEIAACGTVIGMEIYSKPEETSYEAVLGFITGFIPGQAFVFIVD
ncbi:MAG: hypothetical protein AAB486_04860 [Patescibacteria group bacterium]